jgi:hypothetical protein
VTDDRTKAIRDIFHRYRRAEITSADDAADQVLALLPAAVTDEQMAQALYAARYRPGLWGGVPSDVREMYLDMARGAIALVHHGDR